MRAFPEASRTVTGRAFPAVRTVARPWMRACPGESAQYAAAKAVSGSADVAARWPISGRAFEGLGSASVRTHRIGRRRPKKRQKKRAKKEQKKRKKRKTLQRAASGKKTARQRLLLLHGVGTAGRLGNWQIEPLAFRSRHESGASGESLCARPLVSPSLSLSVLGRRENLFVCPSASPAFSWLPVPCFPSPFVPPRRRCARRLHAVPDLGRLARVEGATRRLPAHVEVLRTLRRTRCSAACAHASCSVPGPPATRIARRCPAQRNRRALSALARGSPGRRGYAAIQCKARPLLGETPNHRQHGVFARQRTRGRIVRSVGRRATTADGQRACCVVHAEHRTLLVVYV